MEIEHKTMCFELFETLGVLQYFRPGFHPWNQDNRDRIDPWRKSYARSRDPRAATEDLMTAIRAAGQQPPAAAGQALHSAA